MDPIRAAILRTCALHMAWNYAPTIPELVQTLDIDPSVSCTRADVMLMVETLVQEKILSVYHGRISFADAIENLVVGIESRDIFQPRKRRRAYRIAKWLARQAGVRFVALANTTALGNARDEGDLDFFVITRAGTIWQTRAVAGLPFVLLRMTPREDEERDAVCLSYFVADDGLDLSSHMLTPDDPYFREWFLALLPLYDDGVSKELWETNAALRSRHPFAERWIPSPDFHVPRFTFHVSSFTLFERFIKKVQMAHFPKPIRERMNTDSRVMVNDQVLKFHTTDGRVAYRERFERICIERGIV